MGNKVDTDSIDIRKLMNDMSESLKQVYSLGLKHIESLNRKIKYLEEQLEEVKQSHRWIKCDEELPKKRLYVLCKTTSNMVVIGVLRNEYWYIEGGKADCFDMDYIEEWQYLPAIE